MGHHIDIPGQQFGRLTAISFIAGTPKERAKWLCKCECGNESKVPYHVLNSGRVKSCGCFIKELFANCMAKTHGIPANTPEYMCWGAIKNRCYNSNNLAYKDYGERGIIVCDRWLNSFQNFYDDMGLKPTKKHSIERINNDGIYEPSNCYWATRKEQANNKRNNVFIEYNGERLTVAQWSEKLGINQHTIAFRLRLNKPIEEVLSSKYMWKGTKPKRLYSYNGQTHKLSEWVSILGLPITTLNRKIKELGFEIVAEKYLKEEYKNQPVYELQQ